MVKVPSECTAGGVCIGARAARVRSVRGLAVVCRCCLCPLTLPADSVPTCVCGEGMTCSELKVACQLTLSVSMVPNAGTVGGVCSEVRTVRARAARDNLTCTWSVSELVARLQCVDGRLECTCSSDGDGVVRVRRHSSATTTVYQGVFLGGSSYLKEAL
jgi:hypothetical protein